MQDIQHSRFWEAICFVTRTDLDILAESNRFDRNHVIWTAIALMLAFLIHTALWTNVASLLVTHGVSALLAGIMIASLICTLEAAMAASDWSLARVLRQSGFDWSRARFASGRILVAFILSLGTSLPFELWLHGPELLHHQDAERRAANAPLIEEAKREKARLHAELVQPVERALAQAEADHATWRLVAQQAAREERDALARSNTAALEAQAEYNGLDRLQGPGPRYKDALLREQQARAEAARTRQREVKARQQTAKLDGEIKTLRAELKRVSGQIEAKSMEIDSRIQRDDRYDQRRDSLLSRLTTLWKLFLDPEVGFVVLYLHILTQLVAICLELILLMVKTVYAPASCYHVRLIARTKLEAARINEELARALAELHGGRRGGLHVTANDNPEPDAQLGDEVARRRRA